jgi:uncharacterized membrane protein HdeD (DUF308 family)
VDYLFIRTAGGLAIRGAIAIVLGIVALMLPGPTFLALTFAFGLYAFVDGVSALTMLFDKRARLSRGWLLLEAIAGILVGIFTAIWPTIAALNLAFVVAAWAIVTGVFKIVNAFRLRKVIHREWLLILSGIASIIFGGILMVSPLIGVIGMMWAIGIFGLVFGAMLIGLSIRVRNSAEIRAADAGETPRAA